MKWRDAIWRSIEKKRKVVEKWQKERENSSGKIDHEMWLFYCAPFMLSSPHSRCSRSFSRHSPRSAWASLVSDEEPIRDYSAKNSLSTLHEIQDWVSRARGEPSSLNRLTRALVGKCLIWISIIFRRLHASIGYWFCANTSTFCYGLWIIWRSNAELPLNSRRWIEGWRRTRIKFSKFEWNFKWLSVSQIQLEIPFSKRHSLLLAWAQKRRNVKIENQQSHRKPLIVS